MDGEVSIALLQGDKCPLPDTSGFLVIGGRQGLVSHQRAEGMEEMVEEGTNGDREPDSDEIHYPTATVV